MRLIDADAALKALRRCQTYLYDARDPELKIELSSAEAAINNLSTILPEKAQHSREGTTKGTTSDLISRTETVEHLRRMLEATVPNTDYDEGFIDGVEFGVSTVSTMPTIQPEPHWIPVERLPEEDGKYMVTIHGYGWNGKTFTSVSVAECISKRWVGNNGVIAWMPLPEEYKPNK